MEITWGGILFYYLFHLMSYQSFDNYNSGHVSYHNNDLIIIIEVFRLQSGYFKHRLSKISLNCLVWCSVSLFTWKNDRLRKVEEYTSSVRNLASTMGMDASEIIATVHPSLDASCGQQSKNISDAILARLNSTVESLKEEKQKRLEKVINIFSGSRI